MPAKANHTSSLVEAYSQTLIPRQSSGQVEDNSLELQVTILNGHSHEI